MAEAEGFLLAAELAKWLNFEIVIIEGDCEVMVKILKGEAQSSPWRIRKTIDDIKALTRTSPQISFNFCPKPANATTHLIAAYAIKNKVQHKWTVDHCPSFITSALDVGHRWCVFPFLCTKKKKKSWKYFTSTRRCT